ncbi:MAG: flavodoxin domain-containing protein [Bellilinea sp.]
MKDGEGCFMKALVIFESVYGNTEKVARAIGAGLAAAGEVLVVSAAEAKPEQLTGLDLLVVGSPTQAFGPIAGTKEFLKTLPVHALKGMKVAAFDTRIPVAEVNSKALTFMAGAFGYAAEKIAKGLKARGGAEVVAPAGFFVVDKEGPLKDGELERAAAWAGEIVRRL